MGVVVRASGAGSAIGLGVVSRGAEHAAVTSVNPSRVSTPVPRIQPSPRRRSSREQYG
ncbi:hypothetical protein MUY14_17615 [Amycolatopsis sp. FBCC-B4732]|uniref:hypothetical protein n=1 Tax=Amycolatopsis sp. FBCC-B4732 TaxID=3079339 RepID=UPI001FF22B4E|nr:hypothetical protein [Amycolatopsis sp. FBCC-B4732]UOX92345.1 hypothetical protein MUY14_17615 [Amycolatopsis sp. FBCC-B4732]